MNKKEKEIMNYKKLFFSMMVIAMAVTISVGFASCSKDEKKEEVIQPGGLMGKWIYKPLNSQSIPEIQRSIEFSPGGTYYYYDNPNFENPTESEGNYRITASKKTKYMDISETCMVVDSINWIFDCTVKIRDTTYRDASLFTMLVSGNNDFDKLEVYSFLTQISVDFYFNNNYLETKRYVMDY